MVVSWWLLQAPKDEAKSSEELDPDTDDSTRPDKPIRRSAKDKVCLFFFAPVFFSDSMLTTYFVYFSLCFLASPAIRMDWARCCEVSSQPDEGVQGEFASGTAFFTRILR